MMASLGAEIDQVLGAVTMTHVKWSLANTPEEVIGNRFPCYGLASLAIDWWKRKKASLVAVTSRVRSRL